MWKNKNIPGIKISLPEESELQSKIRKIKDIYASSHRSKDVNSSIQLKLRITPTASALNGFATQFRIEGEGSQGQREFMQIARPEVQKIMRENRQARVKIILNCEMSRKELFSENVEILGTYFHSETVENLEATDESAVFDSLIETIEERIKNFNQKGIQLEI